MIHVPVYDSTSPFSTSRRCSSVRHRFCLKNLLRRRTGKIRLKFTDERSGPRFAMESFQHDINAASGGSDELVNNEVAFISIA